MRKTCQIVLGDQTFDVEFPLTIGQLQIVEPAISTILNINEEARKLEKPPASHESYSHMIMVLEACLLPKYPKMSVEEVKKIPIMPYQIVDAYYIIGEEAGIIKKLKPGETAQGEAEAKPSQSTGA